MDLMDHNVSNLPEDDETRRLVEGTRKKLIEMKNWTKAQLIAELGGVFRERNKMFSSSKIDHSEEDESESSGDDEPLLSNEEDFAGEELYHSD